MTFESLGLLPELLRAVREQGYETPTPIQLQAIPYVLEGRDLIAGAQTGTGKTAAFALPLLQRLLSQPANQSTTGNQSGPTSRRHIRALVVTPTRELAIQVEDSIRTYGAHVPLRSTTVFGGVALGPQTKALRAGVDILVATPGRLLDHYGQGAIDFRRLEILVLDEADRMLDMGFIHDIKRILALLPQGRQNLLFSATYTEEIHSLASGLLKNPASVEVARRNASAELVEHIIHPVDREQKRPLLAHLITSRNMFQALVFSRTKHGANHLALWLTKQGISCAPIHGDRSQSQRVRALGDFKAAKIQVLVATDIAARGLDIDQLPHVINFDLPQVPEDYVHRAGRTGRAGSKGEAISLVSEDERKLLRDIEKMLGKSLPVQLVPGYEPDPVRPPAPRHLGHDRGPRQNHGRPESAPRQNHSRPEPARHHPPTGTHGSQGQASGSRGQAQRGPAREAHRPPAHRPTQGRDSGRTQSVKAAVDSLVRDL